MMDYAYGGFGSMHVHYLCVMRGYNRLGTPGEHCTAVCAALSEWCCCPAVLHKVTKTKVDVLLIVCFFPPFTLQVFPSQDPLDRADFNAVEYINTLFPTEQVSCAHSTSLSSV